MSASAGAGAAGSGMGINLLPSPEELSARTVAVVSHIPAESRAITTAELNRAVTQVATQSRSKATPATERRKHKALEEEALGELLDGLWIQGQAMEMEIFVTNREVSTGLAQIKKESFKTKRQFRSFLEHSHLTLGDVRYRVELHLLSARIQQRLIRGIRSQKEAQEKLSAFLAVYSKRWRSRTVCAPRHATEQCSNGPAPETEFRR